MLPRVLFSLALISIGQNASAQSGTATLPLEELIKLRQTKTAPPEQPKPPVSSTVDSIELVGRLLDSAIDLTAKFQVRILEDQWISVPLLKLHDRTNIVALPALQAGVLTQSNGHLVFMINQKGTYKFEVSILERAAAKNGAKQALVEYAQATSAQLVVIHDEGLFELATNGGLKVAEGTRLYPRDKRFVVAWSRLAGTDLPKAKALKRPPVDSVITSAHASIVATLEGTQITRVRYDLRFEGTKPIQVTVPDHTVVEKVYLNGVAVPFEIKGETLSLEVAPARAGDQSGKLEMVLSTPKRSFNLSGRLDYLCPKVSWPTNELFVEVYLPQVFNYAWSGGSLAPRPNDNKVQYTYKMPTPGKRLSYHQYLIAGASPSVAIDYTIALEGQYFRGSRRSSLRGVVAPAAYRSEDVHTEGR